MPDIHEESERLLLAVSRFLSKHPRAVTGEDVREMGMGEEGYRLLLAALLGLDLDRRADYALYRACFGEMVRRLDPAPYEQDAYRRAVGSVRGAEGGFSLGMEEILPMELFVRDDMVRLADGHVVPRLGWFDRAYAYPALREDGRIWMTVTPNEVNTIRPAAERSRGRVLCCGLGLGYYAFHALLNPAVSEVTVAELDGGLIRLFDRLLRPRFPHADRLRIVQADAFDFVRDMPDGRYDTVFVDLWHDAGDGVPLYRRMKALERPGVRFLYWIEDTMKFYL